MKLRVSRQGKCGISHPGEGFPGGYVKRPPYRTEGFPHRYHRGIDITRRGESGVHPDRGGRDGIEGDKKYHVSMASEDTPTVAMVVATLVATSIARSPPSPSRS